MNNNKAAYKQIFNATSLFGGLHLFSVTLSILKSKIVAILLGVSGVGILGVLTTSLNLILGLSRLGLDFSSVKEIAVAKTSLNELELSKKVTITQRLAWFTGVFGALIIIIISPLLSQVAFGNTEFTLAFIIISIAVLFNQMTVANMAILQGFKQLNKLAKATVLASFVSVIIAAIVYYFFRLEGIPWVISLCAVVAYLFSRFYASKVKISKVYVSFKQVINQGQSIIKFGLVLSLGNLASLIALYAVQIFVVSYGDIDESGFYNAGLMLINTYALLFFNALSKDFFPRLSEVSNDNSLVTQMVNQQAAFSVLLLTPIVVLFLVLRPFIVTVLYTEAFLPILGMISFGIVGTIFKAISWAMGFIIVAKGHSRLYLKVEIISNLALFTFVALGYIMFGLTGIGIGYMLYYMLYAIFLRIVVGIHYHFAFSPMFNQLALVSVFVCGFVLYLVQYNKTILGKILIIVMVIFSIVYTLIMLNKLIGLKNMFTK